jgi:hypothetical protein
MSELKFKHTDNGNCRVYYRYGRALRCFQEDRPGEFTYYICSKDGEPECEAVTLFEPDRLPDEDSATAKAFRKWWRQRATIEEALNNTLWQRGRSHEL